MPPLEPLDRAIALHSTPFGGDGFHPGRNRHTPRRVPPFDCRIPPPPAYRPQRTGRGQPRLLRDRRLDVVPRYPRLELNLRVLHDVDLFLPVVSLEPPLDRKSTRLNSSHSQISYAVFC